MNPRRVIVTGGATNIGLAITESFLAGGSRVAVGQPDPGVTVPLVARFGDRVISLRVDIGDPAQCRQFVDTAARALGGLDVLVNNAAMTGPPAISKLDGINPAQFDLITRVNLGGAIFCSQAAVPYLREAGGGAIIHISSVEGMRPQDGGLVYAATKAGICSLAQSMAKELAPFKIRVVAVAPGDIRVDSSAPMADEAGVNPTPLGRGEPADVASTVAFLSSAQAKFVTGVTWIVDGGLLA